jgi:hypothetical protein
LAILAAVSAIRVPDVLHRYTIGWVQKSA